MYQIRLPHFFWPYSSKCVLTHRTFRLDRVNNLFVLKPVPAPVGNVWTRTVRLFPQKSFHYLPAYPEATLRLRSRTPSSEKQGRARHPILLFGLGSVSPVPSDPEAPKPGNRPWDLSSSPASLTLLPAVYDGSTGRGSEGFGTGPFPRVELRDAPSPRPCEA